MFNNIAQGAKNQVNNLGGLVKSSFNNNSILSKVVFVICILICFFIALRLGSYLLIFLFSPKNDPILIKGMIDARRMKTISQDPSKDDSIPIVRSINKYQGMQFTWSTWLYIEDTNYINSTTKLKHIFHKGSTTINESDGIFTPNNAPGLYLDTRAGRGSSGMKNNLVVIMSTFDNEIKSLDDTKEKIIIPNIPSNKWINVIIRVSNQNILDVYINGSMKKRYKFKSIPKQNYGDVHISMNGGFDGYLSELRYFNKSIGTNMIQNIVDKGPNLALLTDSNIYKAKPYYLSNQWYSNDILTGYS